MRWVALLLLAGCYAPHPAEGAPCTADPECPSPQRCVMGSCSLGAAGDAGPVDAAPSHDAPDAPADAAALACGATGNVCGGGGLSIHSCAQRCWLVCDGVRTHDDAEKLCANWQGTLAELDDATEQACLAPDITTKTWIGLAQTAGANKPTESWTWGGTRSVTFTRWQGGVPNDADGNENGDEQCGHIQPDGTWDDAGCGVPHAVACERPAR